MKKMIFLLTCITAFLNVSAGVEVCGVFPDANGHFNSSYIKSGTITWDESSKTLTLNNAVIEYNTTNVYDNIRPIRISEDVATIVVHGQCKVTTNGFVAIAFESYNEKRITIQGDGNLYTSSTWIDLFVRVTKLTIKDIYIETVNGIADNGNGVLAALTFDNVQAYIKGNVERIGEGINFKDCSITYPADAYIGEISGYGYAIFCGNEAFPDHIVISRGGNIRGDVNGDGAVNIADVNAVISAILASSHDSKYDVNGDYAVNIADVNAIISIILNQ